MATGDLYPFLDESVRALGNFQFIANVKPDAGERQCDNIHRLTLAAAPFPLSWEDVRLSVGMQSTRSLEQMSNIVNCSVQPHYMRPRTNELPARLRFRSEQVAIIRCELVELFT